MLPYKGKPAQHLIPSLWKPAWLPRLQVDGESQIPCLEKISLISAPDSLRKFSRVLDTPEIKNSFLHGFVADADLIRLYSNPEKFLKKISLTAGFITPDFSVLRGMPIQDRMSSVWASRAVGTYFQSRGIQVVPNIRWAYMSDLDFALAGVPKHSTICFSTQGIAKHSELMQTFIEGLGIVLKTLEPTDVLFYGSCLPEVVQAISSRSRLHQYPTEIWQVFSSRRA